MNINDIFNSFSFKLICLFLYIINNNDILIFSYVTIPFYYGNYNTINPSISFNSAEIYYKQMLNFSTYTNIKVNNKIINFHLTFDRFASYISEKDFRETCDNKDNIEENIYSLDYIGITFANFQKNNIFTFLINDTINIKLNNYSLFVVKVMKNSTDYYFNSNDYATEKNEIGLNIVKGKKNYPVDIGGYEPYLTPDYFSLNKKEYNSLKFRNIRKLDTKYILKNGGYNIEEATNLITQLKSNDIISSYALTIKIDNKNDLKGNIIIGGYPHEYDPKHYKEDYFIYDEVNFKLYYFYWNYIFIDIAYGRQKLEWAKNVEFSFEFPFILSNWNYLKYLDEQFFKNEKYAKNCYQEKIEGYYIKYCTKDVIENFQNIYFYLSNNYIKEKQSNYIEFNYQDLFIKSSFDKDIYLFQMIFADNSYKWILGKPLFKKYTTVFDQDKKIFGFYTESGNYTSDNDNLNEADNFKKWFYLIVIIASVFFIFSIVLIVIFCKKYPFNKRKIKANELDDEYDYNTNDKDNNQDGLLIND